MPWEIKSSLLVIMDNFKGQVTPVINKLLEANTIHVCLFNIYVCLLPPNSMDVAVNKPAKSVNSNIGKVMIESASKRF